MNLTSEQIYGLTAGLLIKRYDDPTPIPDLHREMWDLACADNEQVVIAAPRGHAKSTAITHALVLAAVLFREKRYVLIISNTESQSTQFLQDIKTELQENIELIELFGIQRLIKDSVTDIIVEMTDGWKFRITAFGAEQQVRSRKWGGTRPDLIIGDDLENDEMCDSKERREKFRNWFYKALVPSLSRSGCIIIVGTILHMDSLLVRLLNNDEWVSKLYKAHKSFNDFSELLWPEQWPEERLRKRQRDYINEGYPEGYSCEFLNDPIDQSEAFFRKEDFIPMEEEDYRRRKEYYAGIDFAISDADRADFTVICVGGMDSEGTLHIVQVERFKGGTDVIIDMMLDMQVKWDINFWKAEQGAIKLALEGELDRRMRDSGIDMNIIPGIPTKDKRTRARAIQGRIRRNGVRFDHAAYWYPVFELEMLHFPKGAWKDQVDAIAWLGIALKELIESPTDEEWDNMKYEEEFGDSINIYSGRSPLTGY